MGILSKLTTDGSQLSAYNGATPSVNQLATKQSLLHADNDQPGYSLNGNNANMVINYYNDYLDGVNNSIPQPSQLDFFNGKEPSKYIDNLPEGGISNRAIDITG
jgi:hypothetical protein